MATKASETHTAKKTGTKKAMVATFADPPDKDKADALAKMALKPSVNAAAVIVEYAKPFGDQEMTSLMADLSSGIKDVWSGDMKRAEAMLYGQAHALQAMFMNLARRAAHQEHLKQWEAYLRMALKAQNQCRMTLETLATIKNPPVIFARQANINNGGQQQVNNGATAVSRPVRAGEGAHAAISKIERTELLEASDGQRLDTRAAGETGGANPSMETLEPVNRPAHG